MIPEERARLIAERLIGEQHGELESEVISAILADRDETERLAYEGGLERAAKIVELYLGSDNQDAKNMIMDILSQRKRFCEMGPYSGSGSIVNAVAKTIRDEVELCHDGTIGLPPNFVDIRCAFRAISTVLMAQYRKSPECSMAWAKEWGIPLTTPEKGGE